MTLRRILIIVVTVALAVAAGVIYFAFDPARSSMFPRCVFLTLTGYQCPGCGSQRALHALLHGDLFTAWHYNAALIVSLPFLAVYLIAEFKRTSCPRFYMALSSPVIVYMVMVAIVAWWVLRNML